MADDSSVGSGKNKPLTFMEKLFGAKNSEQEQLETEEEIMSLVEEGQEKGLIEDDTKSIIENVFDFDDTVAYEIMTHRRDMTAVEDTADIEEAVKTAISSGHSRIPVYHEDIDNIIGALYVKDLLKFVVSEVPDDFALSDIVRKVLFVPRTKNCRSLFAQMNKQKIQIAIVVDEYGGTEGLITLEDLIEDILGNIQDEYDNEDEEMKKISDTKFTVDGSTPVDDVENLIGEELSDNDSETIAGYMLDKLGRVPSDEEHPVVETDTLVIKAIETEDRRITKILIEKK
ncbi:MAG: HlyC/CorC family transporter [Oscillospiraceae bacterium]|nr:HlyC/CorC family transporter [Candidatus Ruminococcus equi]